MNADLIIVISFLIVNLSIGLHSRKSITSIQDYALGSRKFSTATLSATIIVTWIGGRSLLFGISQIYKVGILAVVNIGSVICFLIIAYILAPRMQEFLGKLSIAEVMGSLYGKHVRVAIAICAIFRSIIGIAVQIKVSSNIFNYFFGIIVPMQS